VLHHRVQPHQGDVAQDVRKPHPPLRGFIYNVTWRLVAADGFCAYFAATGVGMFDSDTRRGGYLQADTAKE